MKRAVLTLATILVASPVLAQPKTAASGRYTISGTTVTLRPIIAKDRWAMGEQAVQSLPLRFEGSDTVFVQFAPALGIRVKLARVE